MLLISFLLYDLLLFLNAEGFHMFLSQLSLSLIVRAHAQFL
ncbi:hypothetical protein ECSTECMHI813_2091 [Escherichia coli STEC_MHI813]|nr:hypothetical protein ECSTECMHI813_2091 [Escherichia coli STEC_MHI813]